mmetsp:Transcript_16459/g.21108  ORF Transcript_16459/g.21108 Transcript_16459/m.21108 type:complete len:226 (+) Transcript_16459:358-1035(+)
MVVVTKGKIAAHRVKLRRFQRCTERICIRHIRLAHRRDQQIGGVKALGRIERRKAAILGLEGLDKCGVGGVVDVLVPLAGVLNTHRRITNRLQDTLIKAERRTNQWQVHTTGRILLQERNPHAARQEEIHAVGTGCTDLRDLGGIVSLPQLGVQLTGQLTFKEALITRQRVFARRIVRREDKAVLQTAVVGISTCRFVQVVVLPRHVEVVRMTALPCEWRRTCVW